MKLTRTVVLTALVLVTARGLADAKDITPSRDPETPVIRTVEPSTGRVGTRHTAIGDFLGESWVQSLYLTDGKEDFKVVIDRQSDITIEFRLPDVKPGKYILMILTRGSNPMYIEQPVYMRVEAVVAQ